MPIYITTVTYKQQKLSNVVNLKCKICQQTFNVASNKNTYRFLAIHQYIIPIHVYITPMCMSIITKLLLKATILSPLTALILPCKGKLTITHLLMSTLDTWNSTLDTWHLTLDTWHLTLDTWHWQTGGERRVHRLLVECSGRRSTSCLYGALGYQCTWQYIASIPGLLKVAHANHCHT